MAVQLWPFRTLSWLFAGCGTLALILGGVGLAGVVVHAVNRQRREFGVRVSVGATPRDLLADVLRSGARLLWPGLLAAAASRLAHAAFVGVDVLNPLVYFAVALVETAIVSAACIVPARRASRTDPLLILRSE